jgi:hypothetical protein
LGAGLLAPVLGAVVVGIALITGASGGDLAAATYRIDLFRRVGLALWDPGWYAGHWTLGYSVLFAPIGAALGIAGTDLVCAVLGAWALDRLLAPRFGRLGHGAAALYALGTVVQVAVGRVPFLLGETLALVALLCATRRLWPLALLLGVAASLASPLAGAFLAIAACAWLLAELPRRNLGAGALVVAALAPIGTLELLFPGQGPMPFSSLDLVGMLVGVAGLGLLLEPSQRALRFGVWLYGAAGILSYLIPSALGVNITRLGTSVGLSLLLCIAPVLAVRGRLTPAAPARTWRARALFAGAFIALALGEWVPAGGALLGASNPSSSAAYYRPLIAYLVAHDHPLGRIEVVPTATHWESVYVALRLPLARGWERQLDTADNPLFYGGRLDARTYRAWLAHNGVRFVALATAPLDYAGDGEAALLRRGVTGLRLVWRDEHWRVWEVRGAPAILSGPGRFVSERGSRLTLVATRPGRIIVRERWSSHWGVIGGGARLGRSVGGWIAVEAHRSGRIVLSIAV